MVDRRQIIAVLLLVLAEFRGAPAETRVDFSKDLAPILEQNCLRCHYPGNEKGGISLATADSLRESEYVVPGRPDESPLLELVTPTSSEPRPKMPKEGQPLTTEQIRVIRKWIAEGAEWSDQIVLRTPAKADRSWWAFQPLGDWKPPEVLDAPESWRANPIDRFVWQKLAEYHWQPSGPADRRTLIRRLTFDLTGLPPSSDEVKAFEADLAPDAYQRLVDRLLASPHYGEHWGRHWLDVVRFGESNGFERNVVINSLWPFRDHVIRSFNDDKPFDQMVHEHLAADRIDADDPSIAVGTAFLVCGPYDNVGNEDPVQAATIRANTIDEMIRACGETFLGVTVGCARCHDHKFDPITQADYYGLYATFAGVFHGERIVAQEQTRQERKARIKALEDTEASFRQQRQAVVNQVLARAANHAESWEATWTAPPVSRYRTEETFAAREAMFVRLVVLNRDDDANANTGFRIDEFEVWTEDNSQNRADSSRNVALASAGATAMGGSRVAEDFSEAYSAQLAIDGQFGARWLATGNELTIRLARPARIDRIAFSSDRTRSLPHDSGLTAFVGDYAIEVSLDGQTWTRIADSSRRMPPTAAHRQRRLLELEISNDERDALRQFDQQIAKVQREIAAVPTLPSLWVGRFESAIGPFHVFLGGDPQRTGPEVVPRSLSMLEGIGSDYRLDASSAEGDRRLALARWLVDSQNPLTPRVLANRLWQWHFGTGIVDTPSDLGYMGGRPTHRELLDWLARQLHVSGWQLKPLHRLIVTSQTYRQSSAWRDEMGRADADSRYLWRFPPRRLAAEEIRDSMLKAAGVLDDRMGGPGFRLYRYLEDNVATYVPLDEHGPETWRRGVYHQNARAQHVDVMSDFDCPDPAFAMPRRSSTTTPLQALTMMNHRFTVEMSHRLARRAQASSSVLDDQIESVFELAYGRTPDVMEREEATELVRLHGLAALCRALFNSSEFIYVN
jgi:hypothetical protein